MDEDTPARRLRASAGASALGAAALLVLSFGPSALAVTPTSPPAPARPALSAPASSTPAAGTSAAVTSAAATPVPARVDPAREDRAQQDPARHATTDPSDGA